MAKIKKDDFIQIKFVGRIKDENKVFDLNDEAAAKKEGLYDPNYNYSPLIVCVGKGDVVRGLDNAFIGKEVGKKFSVELAPEDAFGKRDPRLFHLVNSNKFCESNMTP